MILIDTYKRLSNNPDNHNNHSPLPTNMKLFIKTLLSSFLFAVCAVHGTTANVPQTPLTNSYTFQGAFEALNNSAWAAGTHLRNTVAQTYNTARSSNISSLLYKNLIARMACQRNGWPH